LTPLERHIRNETHRQLTLRSLGQPPENDDIHQLPDETVQRPQEGFFTRLGIAVKQFKWWEFLLMSAATAIGGAVLLESLKKEPKEEVRFVEPVSTTDAPAD